jgi:thioesterase domain-containing protein
VEQYFAKVKHISLINTYGPTETTITATGFLLDTTTEVQERIPIGRANANHQLYILNSSKQLCPIGVVGELYIGGEGLARGYLNQPELTKSVFIKHVLVNGQNQRTEHRLYKTGDLVKCLPNGQVVFIGRVDDQVKIRGFRVELGEIANQIMDLPSVASAMVLTKLSQLGDQKLVAYIKQRQVQLSTVKPIAAEQQQQFCSAIEQHLTAVLPNYMVPKSFVVIDEWPLTPNGKVDKKALLTLPELSIARTDIPPVSETAMQLAQLWASLLQLDPANISNSANFFELGGHSLLIGHLTNKISQVFGCDLSIVDIYQHQKLNEMAQLLLNFTKPSSAAVEKAQDPYLIHLKVGAPEFPAVFLVPPVGGNITQFIALSGMMDFPGAVYSFDARLVNAESIKEMAAVYVAAILTVQPQGRYFVGGWSMGGVVALEIANQLKADGGQVPTVLMIDSFAPMLSSHEDISAERQTDFTDELVRQFVKELELTIVDSDLVSLQVLAKDAIEPLLSALLEIAKQQRKLPQDYPLQELLTRYQLYARDSRMLHAHRPSYFDGAISLIRASDNRHPDPQLGWERYVASIEVSEAPGDHFSMFSPANITDLATQLNTKMAAWMA